MKTKETLKYALTPLLREAGFKGSFPHFRRFRSGCVELLSVQFDKWGSGKFLVEIAVAPRGDYKTYWGKEIPETRLKAQDISERLRLGATNTNEDHWFPNPDSNPEKIALTVISLLKSQGIVYFNRIIS